MKVWLVLAFFGQVYAVEGPSTPDQMAACQAAATVYAQRIDALYKANDLAKKPLPKIGGIELKRSDVTHQCVTTGAKPKKGDLVATLGSF